MVVSCDCIAKVSSHIFLYKGKAIGATALRMLAHANQNKRPQIIPSSFLFFYYYNEIDDNKVMVPFDS